MEEITWLWNTNINIYILKILIINICTCYSSIKLANIKHNQGLNNKILISIAIIIVTLLVGFIRSIADFSISIIALICLLTLILTIYTKTNFGYSMLITTISLSINYIVFLIAIIVSFIPYKLLGIQNEYINLIIIITFYGILVHILLNAKRIKNGFSFLDKNKDNEYFNWMIINISIIILFLVIISTNYQMKVTARFGIGLIIFSIIMFITIQKSLQLYYKQKLLIQELNETKKELDKKKQEIEQLERENLNFSKTSHSIAHRQKALEYKLNQLILKTEIASEIDIKDKINEIAKELQTPTEVELSKTNISEIDNMLKYMQSECVKNKIDFQLQLSGNIHHMINKYVSKENLEILIADHIKNSIIAINHSDNINKSILIRLGIIDGIYSLYIYDSGVEFEIDTLLKLGKIPSTTHSDDGGTGMGFMNTFDTLKKYKASIVIKEYGKPCKDNYTKLIIIKFDDKNEYKICSYRQKEIKNKDNNNNLIVEELSL